MSAAQSLAAKHRHTHGPKGKSHHANPPTPAANFTSGALDLLDLRWPNHGTGRESQAWRIA